MDKKQAEAKSRADSNISPASHDRRSDDEESECVCLLLQVGICNYVDRIDSKNRNR